MQGALHDRWLTFYAPDRADALADGFGALQFLTESRYAPGADGSFAPSRDVETLTYVTEGTLAHQDSTGRSGVLLAGEFQRWTGAHGVRRTEGNASRTDTARAFHLQLAQTQMRATSSEEHKRFSAAERRGVLCVVASGDGRNGSLRMGQDARIHSAMLEPGKHVVHEILPGRAVWLHVVHGEVTLGELALTAGDGAGFAGERAASITARESSELLLCDVAEGTSRNVGAAS